MDSLESTILIISALERFLSDRFLDADFLKLYVREVKLGWFSNCLSSWEEDIPTLISSVFAQGSIVKVVLWDALFIRTGTLFDGGFCLVELFIYIEYKLLNFSMDKGDLVLEPTIKLCIRDLSILFFGETWVDACTKDLSFNGVNFLAPMFLFSKFAVLFSSRFGTLSLGVFIVGLKNCILGLLPPEIIFVGLIGTFKLICPCLLLEKGTSTLGEAFNSLIVCNWLLTCFGCCLLLFGLMSGNFKLKLLSMIRFLLSTIIVIYVFNLLEKWR